MLIGRKRELEGKLLIRGEMVNTCGPADWGVEPCRQLEMQENRKACQASVLPSRKWLWQWPLL